VFVSITHNLPYRFPYRGSNNIKIGDKILIKEKKEGVGRSDNIFLQMGRDFVKVCPKCKCFRIFVRNRKKPKYRCHDCGYEFDDPKALIVPKTQKQRKEIGKQYSNPDQ
jgi:tRNA(Ile2) C34 agmatinyltransferase TiaS